MKVYWFSIVIKCYAPVVDTLIEDRLQLGFCLVARIASCYTEISIYFAKKMS